MLRHPTNAEGWKHVDSEFFEFASDPRNVGLGLVSDGFNPLGHISTMYMLIPGPRSPGKEIDVYLQLLIEELKQLWSLGVLTYPNRVRKGIGRVPSTWKINRHLG
ncbi:putative transposase protein [Cucumis melo var. makuwa]|uniref:Putative transposase protein n=1 Tax=Cucumis melo var. makuwa TaxID=1194695 RepID=A0A5D3BXE1_CUCMM|nr:putative transposase protein [Cucumis melo var. makuwa]